MASRRFSCAASAFLALLSSACGGQEDATAATAQNTKPVRVEGNTVLSDHDPALRIKVDPSFSYLGRHDIRIGEAASGERIIFADVENGKAARLFILQFEGFKDGVDDTYKYDLSKSPEVAGYRWRSNAFAFSAAESVKSDPGAETAATAAFLRGQNVDFPKAWMLWRSLTVTTDDRRNELILFYVEDLAATGKTLADVYDENDESTPFWLGLTPALERRANASFALASPADETWRPLPRTLSQPE